MFLFFVNFVVAGLCGSWWDVVVECPWTMRAWEKETLDPFGGTNKKERPLLLLLLPPCAATGVAASSPTALCLRRLLSLPLPSSSHIPAPCHCITPSQFMHMTHSLFF